MEKSYAPPSVYNPNETEWEVLYLLYDGLDQLRKMTLSFSELRYLAVEHTEDQIRVAVESLLKPDAQRGPLITQIPNLANIPIYRITPTGRDMVKRQRATVGRPGNPAAGR